MAAARTSPSLLGSHGAGTVPSNVTAECSSLARRQQDATTIQCAQHQRRLAKIRQALIEQTESLNVELEAERLQLAKRRPLAHFVRSTAEAQEAAVNAAREAERCRANALLAQAQLRDAEHSGELATYRKRQREEQRLALVADDAVARALDAARASCPMLEEITAVRTSAQRDFLFARQAAAVARTEVFNEEVRAEGYFEALQEAHEESETEFQKLQAESSQLEVREERQLFEKREVECRELQGCCASKRIHEEIQLIREAELTACALFSTELSMSLDAAARRSTFERELAVESEESVAVKAKRQSMPMVVHQPTHSQSGGRVPQFLAQRPSSLSSGLGSPRTACAIEPSPPCSASVGSASVGPDGAHSAVPVNVMPSLNTPVLAQELPVSKSPPAYVRSGSKSFLMGGKSEANRRDTAVASTAPSPAPSSKIRSWLGRSFSESSMSPKEEVSPHGVVTSVPDGASSKAKNGSACSSSPSSPTAPRSPLPVQGRRHSKSDSGVDLLGSTVSHPSSPLSSPRNYRKISRADSLIALVGDIRSQDDSDREDWALPLVEERRQAAVVSDTSVAASAAQRKGTPLGNIETTSEVSLCPASEFSVSSRNGPLRNTIGRFSALAGKVSKKPNTVVDKSLRHPSTFRVGNWWRGTSGEPGVSGGTPVSERAARTRSLPMSPLSTSSVASDDTGGAQG